MFWPRQISQKRPGDFGHVTTVLLLETMRRAFFSCPDLWWVEYTTDQLIVYSFHNIILQTGEETFPLENIRNGIPPLPLPYDVPLTPYEPHDEPFVPEMWPDSSEEDSSEANSSEEKLET